MTKKALPPKKAAAQNSSVTIGQKNSQRVIKEGTPLDHALKHQASGHGGQRSAGMSKGVTLNMGDYQSLRVDCWLSDTVKQGESVEDAFQRVGAIIDEQLLVQVSITQKEFE